MGPVLLHFILLVVVMLLAFWSKERFEKSVISSYRTVQVVEYGQASRNMTLFFFVLMGGLIFFGARMTGSLSAQDWLACAAISIGYAVALLAMLDRRVVLTDEWVSSGMSLLNPERIPLGALQGASVESTDFFGGVTTIKTATIRVKVWHQMRNHEALLANLLKCRKVVPP